ncbi:MAG: serine hydrolase [Cyanobacteria bacterium P01_D01_bin.156]
MPLRVGINYEELLTERVLQPLGLSHTAITLSPWMKNHLAYGHNGFGDPVPLWDMPTLAGAGALRSTVSDMLDFAASNLSPDNTSLGPALKDAQRIRRELGEGGDSIGLNWIISKPGERTITWHNGGTGGYRTFLGLDLQASRAVVVLANSGGNAVDDVGFHLLDPTIPLKQPSAAPVIASTYRTKGIEKAIQHYQSLCSTDHFQIDERALNNVGYWLLRQELIEDAIELFRLNVETYSDVPNLYDSLGDAYMAAGSFIEARESYERAVKLAETVAPLGLSLYRANLEKAIKQLSQ